MGKVEILLLFTLLGIFSVECLRIYPQPIRNTGEYQSSPPNVIRNDPRCQQNGMFKNPRDCTSYYVCVDGDGQDRTCPEGLKFHPIKYCTLDDDVVCGNVQSALPADEKFQCPEDYGMFAYPEDCHKYAICIERESEIQNCPPHQVYQEYVGCVVGDVCLTRQNSLRASRQNEYCLLPYEVGPCKASIPRYYYDINTGQCKKFFYGGCQGNGNNFKSMPECEFSCLSRLSEGGLEENFQCPEAWGIFAYPEDCHKYATCVKGEATINDCPPHQVFKDYVGCVKGDDCPTGENSLPASRQSEQCLLPYEIGPCRAEIPRYYYDINIGRCKKFLYGGCEGNGNNFKSMPECELACLSRLHEEITVLGAIEDAINEQTSTMEYELNSDFNCSADGRYKVPGTCIGYVQCMDNLPTWVRCGPGMNYNARTERCEDICEAHCEQSFACYCEWPTCNSTWKCEKPDSKFADVHNCRGYVQCIDSVPYFIYCRKNQGYSTKEKRCVLRDESDCRNNNIIDIMEN